MNMIEIQDLGKCYRLKTGGRAKYFSLRENISQTFTQWLHPGSSGAGYTDFWALQGIHLEIGAGEVVGIVGANGAGKSTLLKILSRITKPTTGRAVLRGRIASLLEVGTGFHPELTGRENLFLSGTILGMGKSEIKKKFDEIVAFAEVEKFLDTPVKRYSSGMYVRLAFAVAAHLEPEILVVDEVLAVGDAQFQKKCLGKMQDVSQQMGRTILFVSHNMNAITKLCQRGIWLDQGKVRATGSIQDVIRQYLDQQRFTNQNDLAGRHDRKGSGEIRFSSISVRAKSGAESDMPASGAPVEIEIGFENHTDRHFQDLRFNISVDDGMTQRVTAFSNRLIHCPVDLPPRRRGRLLITIEKMPLIPGRYSINLLCQYNGSIIDLIYQAGVFELNPGSFFQSGAIDDDSPSFGVCMMEHRMEYSQDL
jgi:lipopolysaccharide transport system ATP-binding protein